MDELKPLPVGSVVDYTGSGAHGRYVVTSHGDPALLLRPELSAGRITPDGVAEAYPDGVAYEIWPEGVEVRFGNRHLSLYRVRRKSLALVPQVAAPGLEH